ncbi:MAG: peptidoglycan DD-metalloendopeptidase family protein [Bacteroidales bacterium]|nr:peptidoglycan DD-metalloendopeptidase family protein [Bacteroidales bacterium]
MIKQGCEINLNFLVRMLMIACLMLSVEVSYCQSKEELEEQKRKIEQDINYTNKLLDETKTEKQSSINKVYMLNKNIKQRDKLIKNINHEIVLLDKDINKTSDSIENMKALLKDLKTEYANMIVSTWQNQNTYKRLSYIFDSNSISQAFRRIQAFKAYSDKRKEYYNEIVEVTRKLQQKQISYEDSKSKKEILVQSEKNEKNKLEADKKNQNQIVQNLSQKEKELKKKIAKQQQELNKLTKEIERLIAEEMKSKGNSKRFKLTPEEQLISDNFVGNKGKLPWPTERGMITLPFGEQSHPVLANITINNPGVNILTEENSTARCVFDGEVMTVKKIAQFNVVIVRHGEYLTVYSNLGQVFVSQGQKIKAKEKVGTIMKDASEGTTELHFEIWKGSTIQNPEDWMAK